MKTKMKGYFSLLLCAVLMMSACGESKKAEWVATTASEAWASQPVLVLETASVEADADVFPEKQLQTISGFGACFNELGWSSLSFLSETDRNQVMEELFSPGKGANFTVCRMPVGANDFSLNWYSYNETAGDLAMEHFSIANDEKTLIPFILQAKKYNPDVVLWASPWSPPSWLKDNNHYACRADANVNDLKGPPVEREGSNMFIQKDEYMQAYALYFGKFIDEYAKKDIQITMVAPQNEFNSCQNFPSCTWTAGALAKFVGQYLGPEMEKRGVQLMFGTMERPDGKLVDTVLTDVNAKKYVTSVGFQWAGKDAIKDIHQRYPDMKLYQTEQECGNGRNDWKGAAYSWQLMEHYLSNGASVYDYWNISLAKGGVSRWGWAQNSLVVVDTTSNTYVFTPEYYVLKHYSHYIQPGAYRLETSGYEHLLAFRNPDGSIVITAGNFENEDQPLKIRLNKQMIQPTLKANSVNTFVIGVL